VKNSINNGLSFLSLSLSLSLSLCFCLSLTLSVKYVFFFLRYCSLSLLIFFFIFFLVEDVKPLGKDKSKASVTQSGGGRDQRKSKSLFLESSLTFLCF
jgi:hypothetical protein